ncbi:MAG: phosphoribosylformylglycinamidine synthase II, partial [Nitrospirae bacterium]
AEAAALCRLLEEAARRHLLRSAHDCSDGGIAVALAECLCTARAPGLGCRVELGGGARPDATLFGESAGRVVVSLAPEAEGRWQELLAEGRVAWRPIGEVTGDGRLRLATPGAEIDLPATILDRAWRGALPELLEI